MDRNTSILFIGLDSADPDLLIRWGEEGVLPSIQALRQSSLRGETLMPAGLGTGAMWISLFSGVSPARHGRYFGRQIEDDPYRVVRFDPNAIKQQPMWNAASRAGHRVAIIDIPLAPLAEELNGIQIKDWGSHDTFYPSVRTYPAALAAEITARFGSDPVGPCEKTRATPQEFLAFRDRLVERVERKTDIARHFLKQGGWDLFMIGYGDAHCVGHQCWHLHDERHAHHDRDFARATGDPVKDVYIALDKAVGRLLEEVSPDTTILLFAGSGMGPNYTGNHLLEEVLRRLEGVRHTPARRAILALKRVYPKLLPEKLRAWLRPFGNRVDESSLSGDRAGRKFYTFPHNDLSGAIRFNLAGRERNGVVAPGAPFEALRDALIHDLLALKNHDSGTPLVRDVLKTSDIYAGEYVNVLPDLLVLWNREHPIAGASSDKIGIVRQVRVSERTGDHTFTAKFLAHGPHIVPGELNGPVAVEDFAATLAKLMNVALPDVDGVPISGVAA